MVLGYRESMTLPDSPAAPGQKFTQSASALFGGIIVGAVFELVSLLPLAVALLHSRRRRMTLLAGVPVVAFAIVFIGLGWAGR